MPDPTTQPQSADLETIQPRYARLHAAWIHYSTTQKSIREVAKLYNVSNSQLQRAARGKLDFLSEHRGRKPFLSEAEENVICEAVMDFSKNNTPLSKGCFLDLVETFISALPPSRRKQIAFKNNRPGKMFITNFLKRHSQLSFKRRMKLESSRANAMTPQNVAKHFARLHQVYQMYLINSAEQIFNLDESGFSVRTADRARSKAIFHSGKRSYSVEINWSGNAEHVTIMPVVSADGRVWRPLVVLLGKRTKWRTLEDGTKETPSHYLPQNAYIVYRDPAGVDSKIFLEWAKRFVEETKELRKKHRYIVLVFDGYGAHVSYPVLKMLRDNNIIAVGLPAHSSHRTQVLDYSVFSPFKTQFRNLLNRRVVGDGRVGRNDVYSLCEIIHTSYKASLTYANIINGFKACGVWCSMKKGVVPQVINARDITNFSDYSSQENAHIDYLRLVEMFKNTRGLLRSDGVIRDSGCLDTRDGALLTSDEVMKILKDREEAKAAAEKQKTERVAASEQRRVEKERMALLKVFGKAAEEAQKAENQAWLGQRSVRARHLIETRRARRDLARLRASKFR